MSENTSHMDDLVNYNEKCVNCSATHYCKYCEDCVDCIRCEHCYHCAGLTREKWFIMNEPPGSKQIDENMKNLPSDIIQKINAIRSLPEYQQAIQEWPIEEERRINKMKAELQQLMTDSGTQSLQSAENMQSVRPIRAPINYTRTMASAVGAGKDDTQWIRSQTIRKD